MVKKYSLVLSLLAHGAACALVLTGSRSSRRLGNARPTIIRLEFGNPENAMAKTLAPNLVVDRKAPLQKPTPSKKAAIKQTALTLTNPTPAANTEGEGRGNSGSVDAINGAATPAVYRVAPAYPETARKTGIEAIFQVSLRVDPNGAVISVEIGTHKYLSLFKRSIEEALRQWKFKSDGAYRNFKLPIEFRLET